MNVWDIVKEVGGGVIADMVPGGRAVMRMVNKFLPEDAQLPDNATGSQAADAIQSLPADQRAQVMNKKFDIQITEIKESHSTVRAMLEAEAKSTHTTRPRIALGAFRLIAFATVLIILGWLYAVLVKDAVLVKSIVDGWPFVFALLAPFVGWLNRYFGILKDEQKNKMDAANGLSAPSGITGMISSLIKR